jgi:hypothetical protein
MITHAQSDSPANGTLTMAPPKPSRAEAQATTRRRRKTGAKYYADKPSGGPDWGIRLHRRVTFPQMSQKARTERLHLSN